VVWVTNRLCRAMNPLRVIYLATIVVPLLVRLLSERETIDRILQAVGYERRTGPRARAPARTTGQAELPPN
jgi:hypothetical protein